jgi:hypothetical protein
MANNIHILWLRILLYPSISSIHQQFILWASVSFNFSPFDLPWQKKEKEK